MNKLRELLKNLYSDFEDSPAWIATATVSLILGFLIVAGLVLGLAAMIIIAIFTVPEVAIGLGVITVIWLTVYFLARR